MSAGCPAHLCLRGDGILCPEDICDIETGLYEGEQMADPMTLPSDDATLAKIIMRHEWAASRGIANVCTGDIENLLRILRAERAKSEGLRRIVDQQAEDDGLWFKAETAAEAYVQQELRKLHAAVEALSTSPSPTPQQDAVRALLKSIREPTNTQVMAALEWALAWMKENGVDHLSPYEDFPSVTETTKGMWRAMVDDALARLSHPIPERGDGC